VARCPAITRSGEQCKGVVRPGDTYCVAHDPARQEERRRNARKAGKSRPSREIGEIKALLKDLTDRVLEGEIPTAVGAVANQLINTRLRALEYERRVRELEEIERRLTALEDVRYQEERSAGYGGL
jgi:hypothetical protein